MSKAEKKLKKADAVIEAFKSERLRWIMGLSVSDSEAAKSDKYHRIMSKVIDDEIERKNIITELKSKGPLTVKEISEATGLSVKRVLDHIIALRKLGAVAEAGERGEAYLYKAT